MYGSVEPISPFESPSPEAPDRPAPQSVLELLVESARALELSPEAAKTPFARASKTLLKEVFEHSSFAPAKVHHALADALPELLERGVLHIVHRSITVPVTNLVKDISRVFDDLSRFAFNVSQGVHGKEVTIIGGLDLDLRKVNATHVSFSWKLRFVVHNS